MNGSTYSWYFTDVAPGTYHVYITIGKLITNNDWTNITIENDAYLDYTDINGNQPYPTKHAHAEIDISLPLMKITKTVNPNSGTYGDYLSVTIQMNNNLANATMIEYLPKELAYTGNGIDDDSDGLIDEEAKDGIDNDGDGKVDEDLGNFKYDGNSVSTGLNVIGNNLTFSPVQNGSHTITFDIMIIEKTLIKHITTNLVHLVFGDHILGKDTADITLHVYNQAPTTIISCPENNSKHYEDVPISFCSDDSYDDGSNVTYSWDFGDGNTSTEKNPSHTYADPGIYNVTLTITDSLSNSTSSTIQLIILKSTPTPRIVRPFRFDFEVGQNISFKGKAHYHGNYSTLNYTWDLGDNTTMYGRSFIHSYLATGTYIVTLTVTDPDGDFGTAQITITISNETDDEKPDKPDHPDKPGKPDNSTKPKENNKYKSKNQPAEPARKPNAPFNSLPDFDNIQPNVPAVENSNSPSGPNPAVAASGFVAKNYQMITNGSSSKKKDKDDDNDDEPENSSFDNNDNDNNDDREENNDNGDGVVAGE
jgi:PKD repeat protein